MGPRGVGFGFCVLLLFRVGQVQAQGPGSSSSQPAQAVEPGAPDPVLVRRPPPKAPSAAMPEGQLALDVKVEDAGGRPVSGLEPWDFTLLDNDRPTKVKSFRYFGQTISRPDPPVEVILVIDEMNLPFAQVSFVKDQVAAFLRQNGGKLAQPVSIVLLTETGLQVQPRPSTDGNALLSVLNEIKPHISSINPAMGGQGALERTQISVHQMATIAENQAGRPGRKLLVWIGPGWPMLQSQSFRFSERNRRGYFDVIVELTNRLREARIVVYSVAPQDSSMGGGPGRSQLYKDFLKGVATEQNADIGNLALKVLVTNTGGRILGPDNDLTAQINQCIADANEFYRLSFDPPPADHADEYHQLRVQVNRPGLTVRTTAGYYNEPPGTH
jgi:VWFA-related protein